MAMKNVILNEYNTTSKAYEPLAPVTLSGNVFMTSDNSKNLDAYLLSIINALQDTIPTTGKGVFSETGASIPHDIEDASSYTAVVTAIGNENEGKVGEINVELKSKELVVWNTGEPGSEFCYSIQKI